MDYYPKNRRLVLVDIENDFGNEEDPDEALVSYIQNSISSVKSFKALCVHAPTSFPNPKLEGDWIRHFWEQLPSPRPKPFLPYMTRACEIYLRYGTPEQFEIGDAMGANGAPLAARWDHIRHSLPKTVHESVPKVIFTRWIRNMGWPKLWIPYHSNVERGLEVRQAFLEKFLKRFPGVFIYDKDLEKLSQQLHFFNAFLLALHAHSIVQKLVEARPSHFPKKFSWVSLPPKEWNWQDWL